MINGCIDTRGKTIENCEKKSMYKVNGELFCCGITDSDRVTNKRGQTEDKKNFDFVVTHIFHSLQFEIYQAP